MIETPFNTSALISIIDKHSDHILFLRNIAFLDTVKYKHYIIYIYPGLLSKIRSLKYA